MPPAEPTSALPIWFHGPLTYVNEALRRPGEAAWIRSQTCRRAGQRRAGWHPAVSGWGWEQTAVVGGSLLLLLRGSLLYCCSTRAAARQQSASQSRHADASDSSARWGPPHPPDTSARSDSSDRSSSLLLRLRCQQRRPRFHRLQPHRLRPRRRLAARLHRHDHAPPAPTAPPRRPPRRRRLRQRRPAPPRRRSGGSRRLRPPLRPSASSGRADADVAAPTSRRSPRRPLPGVRRRLRLAALAAPTTRAPWRSRSRKC